MKNILRLVILMTFSLPAFAQINQSKEIKTFQKFGAYTVHYNVFNSKLVPPEVAKIYNLTRGKDLALLNISLTKTENGTTTLGLPAQIKAKATDLMQRKKSLEFIEIKEPEATYYLASIRYINEEDLRFEVSVLPPGETTPLNITFNRRLYTEN
ncbi:MAG: DUF4426 domain-containing protein [Pseudomonadota bacterium]